MLGLMPATSHIDLAAGPARDLFDPALIDAELDRPAARSARRRPDRRVRTASPAAAGEWRGHITVRAVVLLRSA